jgi:hypothetical protein
MNPPTVPSIPTATLKALWQHWVRGTLSRSVLEQTAARLSMPLGDLLWGIFAAQGGTGEAAALANSVYTGIAALPEAAELAALQTAAATGAGATLPAVVGEKAVEEVAKKGLRDRLVAAIASRLGIGIVAAGRILTGFTIAGLLLLLLQLGGYVYNRNRCPAPPAQGQPVQQSMFVFAQFLFNPCGNDSSSSTGSGGSGGGTTTGGQPGATACAQQPQVRKKCPWTPEGFEVKECGPGFCYDGGPRGTLACKQENQNVPNARVNDLNNIFCADGFTTPVRDPCTGVLLRCER